MGRTLILLNGDPPGNALFAELKAERFDAVIFADGAYNYAHMHFEHDILIGDLDSAKIPRADDRIEKYPATKDMTDGELAVRRAAEAGAKDIVIAGASGGRDDHIYANFFLLQIAKDIGLEAEILTDRFSVRLAGRGAHMFPSYPGATVSLLPFGGPAHILCTDGLEYGIRSRTLTFSETLGISNISIGRTFSVGVESGSILVFVSRL